MTTPRKMSGSKYCIFCRRRLSFIPTEQSVKHGKRYTVFYCDTCKERYEIQLGIKRGWGIGKIEIRETTLSSHLQSYLRPPSIKQRV